MRKTKIVCTIGPACESEAMTKNMILAGMNVARLNFSHNTHAYHKERIDTIKKLRRELNLPVAILLDTKGPEIRTGKLESGPQELLPGGQITLTTAQIAGNKNRVSVSYANLPGCLSAGNTVMVDDGLIELRVAKIDGGEILCDIVSGGVLRENKSVNAPGAALDMPFINEKDRQDILFGAENDVDFVALSFVRTPEDVREARALLDCCGKPDIELIAKIENTEGVKNIDEIIKVADGIMVARGDMAVEIPFEELPHLQKIIIKNCFSAGKKVITATHMLESMIHNSRPTRAEITDVANAIYDGTSAIMLSGETAIGAHPVRSLETMVKIAEKTESCIDYASYGDQIAPLKNLETNITNAISDATCRAAQDLGAAAIVAVTLSGKSARSISRFRPATPILAVTPVERTYMQLALSWGVTPMMNRFIANSQDLFDDVAKKVLEEGYVQKGDLIVITGSTKRSEGSTNALQVCFA